MKIYDQLLSEQIRSWFEVK